MIEQKLRERLAELIARSGNLSRGDEYGQCTSESQAAECSAWLTTAQNAVHLVLQDPKSPYRAKADKIANSDHGYLINGAVGEFSSVLQALMKDVDDGLLASVANQARAETFDDFLDHAEAYYGDNRKNEAGVIAGVVFEDTLRQICRKEGIPEKGEKLDGLISELTNRGELSGVKAKRARVAAHVRTKASHAQWDEFELDDVKATIEFTRELIEAKLDG
jgi:hypothetical protein